jgi:hypothetical protein
MADALAEQTHSDVDSTAKVEAVPESLESAKNDLAGQNEILLADNIAHQDLIPLDVSSVIAAEAIIANEHDALEEIDS